MSLPESNSPQTQASDPRHSAWVSANAGSGKTTVLVWRVIRLLLDGVPPGRILCLTYTKAAAAHMANEVLKRLSAWVRLDDQALDEALAEIDPAKPSPERRSRARALFSAALETPGGLKVQTIHAFCDRVLHMFPVEAQTPAGFEVLDELGERDMIETARLQVLMDAGRNPDSPLGSALSHCIEIAGDMKIEGAISEAVRARQSLREFDGAAARITASECLGISASDTIETVALEIVEGGTLPAREWEGCAKTLQEFGGNAGKIGISLLDASRTKDPDRYLSVFLNAEGNPRADSSFGKKDDLAKVPAIRGWLFAERARLAPLLGKLRAVRECERSCALLSIASAVIKRYEKAKERRGVLDFADLVTRTVALLEREESAWVHFKLDGGIDHILVDEAQDTSPEQWRIIAKLAEEFFAGKGASNKTRTVFAVGDEKQSIFSFQGADPIRFDEMRVRFAAEIKAAGQSLIEPRLRRSFRSTAVVLGAVDKVFDAEEARHGLAAHDTKGPLHEAVRQTAPGVVEIWPVIVPAKEKTDDEGWDKPLDRVRETSAPMQLARQIALAAKTWIKGGLAVGDRKNGETLRAVVPGDIIVLVQKRGALFDAVLRALKQEGVPVAGADRLVLTENIAVMDLLALGDGLLLTEDDLSLASVLKSPLFGFTDEDLFTLCYARDGSLLQSLSLRKEPRYAEAYSTITRWRENALHLRPFDFYSRVLGRDGGRQKMVSRLGPEAADALDEFLAAALAYESSETPSLHGFLSFVRRASAEVKRDLEAEGTAVRVMTVHGVKGLEAPVIVLADTTTLPPKQMEPRLAMLTKGESSSLIWTSSEKESSPPSLGARNAARELRLQEYRRLLYVALTRAADVLVVCGALNKRLNEPEPGSWYQLVHTALTDDKDAITKHDLPYGKDILRWRTPSLPTALPAELVEVSAAEIPVWLSANWEEPKCATTRLRPSSAPSSPHGRDRQPAPGNNKMRGVLLHRLLQSLPELPATERKAAADRYLLQSAPALTNSDRDELSNEAIRVLQHPDCAEIFSEGSQAEPELIARLHEDGREIEIPARLDRLLVTAKSVTFADFKSDRAVPSTLSDIPAHYISQLAAYREALAIAFPGRDLRALLIFTAAPRVFEIPQESLDFAWQRLKTQASPALPQSPA